MLLKEKRIPFSVHTNYTLSKGITFLKDYMKKAQEWGMKALAITDIGNTMGFYEAEEIGKELGIKIIYGVELYVYDEYINPDLSSYTAPRVTLLAKDQEGLKALYHLTGLARRNNPEKPIIKRGIVNQNRKHLFVGTGPGYFNDVMDYIANVKKLEENLKFYDYVTIEPLDCYIPAMKLRHVSTEDMQKKIISLIDVAEKAHKLIIATENAYYLTKEARESYDINAFSLADNPYELLLKNDEQTLHSANLTLRTSEEMMESILYLGEAKAKEIAIDNTIKLSSFITSAFPKKNIRKVSPLKGAKDYLKSQVGKLKENESDPKLIEKCLEEIRQASNQELSLLGIATLIKEVAYKEELLIYGNGSLLEYQLAKALDLTLAYVPPFEKDNRSIRGLSLVVEESKKRIGEVKKAISSIFGGNETYSCPTFEFRSIEEVNALESLQNYLHGGNRNKIKTILTRNCVSCHPSANMFFFTDQNIEEFATLGESNTIFAPLEILIPATYRVTILFSENQALYQPKPILKQLIRSYGLFRIKDLCTVEKLVEVAHSLKPQYVQDVINNDDWPLFTNLEELRDTLEKCHASNEVKKFALRKARFGFAFTPEEKRKLLEIDNGALILDWLEKMSWLKMRRDVMNEVINVNMIIEDMKRNDGEE